MIQAIDLTPEVDLKKPVKLAQLFICDSSPCGNPSKSALSRFSELKKFIKSHNMTRSFRIQKTGCLGVCKPSNVILIITQQDPLWLGNMLINDDYRYLMYWLIKSHESGDLIEMPEKLKNHLFQRIRD